MLIFQGVLVPFFWDPPRSDGSRFDDHLTNLKVHLFQLHLTEKIIVKLFREQKEWLSSRNSSEAESLLGGKTSSTRRQL